MYTMISIRRALTQKNAYIALLYVQPLLPACWANGAHDVLSASAAAAAADVPAGRLLES